MGERAHACLVRIRASSHGRHVYVAEITAGAPERALLQSDFALHLRAQRGLSEHTVRAYEETWTTCSRTRVGTVAPPWTPST